MNRTGRLASCGPAVARWTCGNGNVVPLCQACLDCWLDNADNDPDLEPAKWRWVAAARPALPNPSTAVQPHGLRL